MGLLIHKSTLVLAILNGPVSSASYFLDLILLCFMLLKMEISMPLTSLLIPRRSLTFYPIKDAAKTRGIFFLKTVSIHQLFPCSSSAWAGHVFFCVQHVKPESGLWTHMIYWEVLFTAQQWRQQDKPWQGPRQGCNFTWGLTSPISVSSEAWVATWIEPKSGAKRSAFCTLVLVSHWLQAASGRRQTSPVFQWLAAWLGEFDKDCATVSNWHWAQLGIGASGCVGHQPHPPVWGGSRFLASVSNLLDCLCSFVVFHRQAFWLLSPQAMPSCLGLWERLSILPSTLVYLSFPSPASSFKVKILICASHFRHHVPRHPTTL